MNTLINYRIGHKLQSSLYAVHNYIALYDFPQDNIMLKRVVTAEFETLNPKIFPIGQTGEVWTDEEAQHQNSATLSADG